MPKHKRKNDRSGKVRSDSARRRRGFRLVIATGVSVVVLAAAVIATQLRQRSDVSHADLELRTVSSLPYTVPARPEPPSPRDESTQQAHISELRERSFEVAENVVAAFPDSADAVCLLATIHHRHSNDLAAVRLWNACLKLDPQCTDALQMLGDAAMEKSDYAQAESHLRRALKIEPKWTTLSPALAEALAHQGKFREAAEVLEQHKQNVPQDALARCRLGEAYQHLADFDAAKDCFEAAIQASPDCADAYYGLALALSALGQVAEAEPYFTKFREISEDQNQASRESRSSFDDLWRMRTTLVATHMTAARVYLRHGRTGAAEQQCEHAAALDPEHCESRELLCNIYSERRDLDSALRVRKELCQIVPENPRHWLQLGILNYQANRMEDAEQAFRRLIELAPEQAEGYLTLAQILMAPDKSPREAVRLARRGVELAATAPNYHILATVYENVGNLESARAALARSIQLDPQNVKYQTAYRRLQYGRPK